MSKAQIALIDFFIAFFLFVIVISATIYTWNLYLTRLNEDMENNEMMIKAIQTTEVLVKSSGVPTRWSLSNVTLVGLAESDRILSTEKVDLFVNLPESQIKNIFRIQLYGFYFAIMGMNNSIINMTQYMEEQDLHIAYYQKETYMDEEVTILLEEFLIDFYYKSPDPGSPDCLDPCLGKDELLENISSYDFILLEDSHFDNTELDFVEDWVANGGWLFISEHMKNSPLDILGVTYFKRGKNENEDVDNMTIINTDSYLDLELGSWLYPEEVPYIEDSFIPIGDELDAVNYVTMGEYEDGTDGIARWEYGNGTVYYFSDFWIKDHSLLISFPSLISEGMVTIIQYLGGGEYTTLLSKGVDAPGSAVHVVSVKRYVVYENEKAILLFKLWK